MVAIKCINCFRLIKTSVEYQDGKLLMCLVCNHITPHQKTRIEY